MNTNEQILNQFGQLEDGDLSMNMKTINSLLTQLFQNYSLSLNKITGNAVFSNTVMRVIQDAEGLSKEYGKGQITFKNGVDKLRYLLKNKERVARAIGVEAKGIYANRRNLGLMSQYIARMNGKYELGNPEINMQMYISKHDNNVQPLDSLYDWVDYILTQDWITSLANRTVGTEIEDDDDLSPLDDYRIEYLADAIQEMMADHEVDYHKDLENFKPDDFLSIPHSKTETTYSKNKINSIGKLDYGFYEMFKPIGGTTEKYIKVKLSTNGILDISGVIGLSDCTKVEWNYGSRAYLRSLNTGNERYEFKLSIPFNDENSQLWWKPDEKERISDSAAGNPRYRYYKPYETERFLRWFGTSYIPLFDLDTIVKKTVCSAPKVTARRGDNSTRFQDATRLLDSEIPPASSVSASQSVLSMAPIATIDLIQKDDGQYLRFVVSGNLGTQNLSFNVRGRLLPDIQEMNHYGNTWNTIKGIYTLVQKHAMFFELTRQLNLDLDKAWELTYPELPYIPDEWDEIAQQMQMFLTPNCIDLIRIRHIDFSSVMYEILANAALRLDFIKNISTVAVRVNLESDESNLAKAIVNNGTEAQIRDIGQNIRFIQELYDVIMKFETMDEQAISLKLQNVNLSEDTRNEMLDALKVLASLDEGPYEISYEDLTVDELRKRIQTFNNLIVRLPTSTVDEKVASRNVFMDWKKFVDEATRYMVKEEMLYVVYQVDGEGNRILDEDGEPLWLVEYGTGTDGKEHPFTEVYIDPTRSIPLVDYSYCKDENGNVIHDRFDYWSVDDFS